MSRQKAAKPREFMKAQYILLLAYFVSFTFTATVKADVVTEWNSAALDAIRADRTPPPKASRALAILHAAIYDAVNGITRTHEPYLFTGMVPASASLEAAASAAAHDVLVNLFPAHRAAFDSN